VIDNGSSRENLLVLRSGLPAECLLLTNARNLGFAGGMNVGIEYALRTGFEYVWLLNNDAGSTPHQSSFLPPPSSSDQMLASARPSSFGKAGADFVSWNVFPRSVERNTFMPKKALQLEAYTRGVPRVSMRAAYTATPGEKGPRRANFPRVFEVSATKSPFLVPMERMTRSGMLNLPRPQVRS
jgi:glycosyltransferase involved in cell wall biosynthesis